jgi:predicted metalloprotease with PDZ domain
MIRYTISMPAPHTHRFHITLEVEGVTAPTLDLALPVWTPGSYMVREYARHLQSFSAAAGGAPLGWEKIDKATWRVDAAGHTSVRITYEVYAFELTVRTSHLDGSHGYFNPATLCLAVLGRADQPHHVQIDAPEGWRASTGLRQGEAPGSFVARDYDELIDSPFEIGTHRLLTFEVEGVPHEIALWGSGNEDAQQLVDDTRRIVEATRAHFDGPLPYERYLFIVQLADGLYGGLEHRNSVTNLLDRWTFRPARSYERFLGLTSHEYYHVWNVKRIRPAPLGPFDYQRENYTRQLWVAEGITSYYDNLILARSGLISPDRYLETLADDILALQSQPGRAVQTLAQSSFDAWIKFYRPDEQSINSSISYYLKGSLVALALDMAIRAGTDGARSLDDVMRYLYTEVYGGADQSRFYDAGAFAEDGGFLAAVESVAGDAGGRYRELLRRAVETTEELDYDTALAAVGLRPEWGYKADVPPGHAPATLGVRLKSEHGRLKVAAVLAGGPAEQAGIYAHDEIIAFAGARVDEERLKARLLERSPGERVAVTLFRGDQLIQVEAQLGSAPHDTLRLVPHPEASMAQQQERRRWLNESE